MATARVKNSLRMPKDTNEVNELLSSFTTADAREREITAKLDQKIAKLREEYAEELSGLCTRKLECMVRVQMWAEANADDFQEKRSMDFAHARIGFRVGMPKLKLKVKGWDKVTEKLKELLPNYVRTVVEPAKDKLLADREVESVNKHFKTCGIEVIQEETFFIEPKVEEIAGA